eukprot:g6160.t1
MRRMSASQHSTAANFESVEEQTEYVKDKRQRGKLMPLPPDEWKKSLPMLKYAKVSFASSTEMEGILETHDRLTRDAMLLNLNSVPERIDLTTISHTSVLVARAVGMCRRAGLLSRSRRVQRWNPPSSPTRRVAEAAHGKIDEDGIPVFAAPAEAWRSAPGEDFDLTDAGDNGGGSELPMAVNIMGTEYFVPVATGYAIGMEQLGALVERAIRAAGTVGVTLAASGELRLLVMPFDAARILQGRHAYVGERLFEAEIRLQQDADCGGVVLLEGQMGAGKSRILSELAAPSAPLPWNYPMATPLSARGKKAKRIGGSWLHCTRTDLNCKGDDYPLLSVACGNPFDRSRPYGVWSDVFMTWLRRSFGENIDDVEDENEVIITPEHIEAVFEHLPAIRNFLPLLWEPLDRHYPPILDVEVGSYVYTGSHISNLSEKERKSATHVVTLALLRVMSLRRKMVVILDDAQWLDEASWQLLLDVATNGEYAAELTLDFAPVLQTVVFESEPTPLLAVVAMRPIEYYLDVVQRTVPEALMALRLTDGVDFYKLGPLSDMSLDLLIREELGLPVTGEEGRIAAISPTFFDVVKSVSNGNPHYVQGLFAAIRDRTVTEGGIGGSFESPYCKSVSVDKRGWSADQQAGDEIFDGNRSTRSGSDGHGRGTSGSCGSEPAGNDMNLDGPRSDGDSMDQSMSRLIRPSVVRTADSTTPLSINTSEGQNLNGVNNFGENQTKGPLIVFEEIVYCETHSHPSFDVRETRASDATQRGSSATVSFARGRSPTLSNSIISALSLRSNSSNTSFRNSMWSEREETQLELPGENPFVEKTILVRFRSRYIDPYRDLPFPAAFRSAMGMRIDRCSVPQQIMMKTASICTGGYLQGGIAACNEATFDYDMMTQLFPIRHLRHLIGASTNKLEDRDILYCSERSYDPPRMLYSFASSLFERAVRNRMLQKHTEDLRKQLQEIKETRRAAQLEKDQLKEFERIRIGEESVKVPSRITNVSMYKNEKRAVTDLSSFRSSARAFFGIDMWKLRGLRFKRCMSGKVPDSIEIIRNNSTSVVQEAFLQNASCRVLEPKERKQKSAPHDYCIEVRTRMWIKYGNIINEPRRFLISFPEESVMIDVKYWIEFCIDYWEWTHQRLKKLHSMRRHDSSISASKLAASTAGEPIATPRGVRSALLFAKNNTGVERKAQTKDSFILEDVTSSSDRLQSYETGGSSFQGRSRPNSLSRVVYNSERHPNSLCVVVYEGCGLRLQGYRNSSRPYCSVGVSNRGKRAIFAYNNSSGPYNFCRTAVVASSTSPFWDEGFALDITAHQAAVGNLIVIVWGKDPHGSDDFLGYVQVPLKSLEHIVSGGNEEEELGVPDVKGNIEVSRLHSDASLSLTPNTSTSNMADNQSVSKKGSALVRNPSKISNVDSNIGEQDGDNALEGVVDRWFALRGRSGGEQVTGQIRLLMRLQLNAATAKARTQMLNQADAKSKWRRAMHRHTLTNMITSRLNRVSMLQAQKSAAGVTGDLPLELQSRLWSEGWGNANEYGVGRLSPQEVEGPLLATWLLDVVKSNRRPTVVELEQKLAEYQVVIDAKMNTGTGLGLAHLGTSNNVVMNDKIRRKTKIWKQIYGANKPTGYEKYIDEVTGGRVENLPPRPPLMKRNDSITRVVSTANVGNEEKVISNLPKLAQSVSLGMDAGSRVSNRRAIFKGDAKKNTNLQYTDLNSINFYFKNRNPVTGTGETVHGPFSGKKLLEPAFLDGRVKEDLFVRQGDDETLPFIPFPVVEAHMLMGIRISEATSTMFSASDLRRNCHMWEFDVFCFTEPQLISLVVYDLDFFGMVDRCVPKMQGTSGNAERRSEGKDNSSGFGLQPHVLFNFLDRVYEEMTKHKNVYHNFYHAVDVEHTAFLFLAPQWGQCSIYFTHLEIFAFLFAALCHDLAHPGLNQEWHVNMSTDLALKYNDNSVLENMHASRTFEIMREGDGEANVFAGLSRDAYKDARKIVLSSILATDMTKHGSVLRDFNEVAAEIRLGKIEKSEKQHMMQRHAVILPSKTRETFLKMLLHSSDISNPTKGWETCRTWADKVCEEFFEQGDMEEKEGIPVGPLRNRSKVNKANMQIGFGDYVVARTFGLLYGIMPASRTPVLYLIENRKKWLKMRIDEIKIDDKMTEKEKSEMIDKMEKDALVKEKEYAAFLQLPTEEEENPKGGESKEGKDEPIPSVASARAKYAARQRKRLQSLRQKSK